MPTHASVGAPAPLDFRLAASRTSNRNTRTLFMQWSIIRELDAALVEGGSVHAPTFIIAYSHFWLWVLAAYEVTRTMHQARVCFSVPLGNRLGTLKKQLSQLRVPFAKQELPGEFEPIQGEAS